MAWTRESMLYLLRHDVRPDCENPRHVRRDVAVWRGLLVLLARQTADEQAGQRTRHQNGRGFSQAHANNGTWLARQVQEWYATPPAEREYPRPLGPGKTEEARRLCVFYVRQLVEHANTAAAA